MTDGEPSLLRTEKGTTAVWRGINLYPGPDPMEYARRKARVFSILPGTLVFVPSVGLGYGLEELLARLPPRSAVICVEAFQPLMALALQQRLPRDERLFIVRTDSEQAVAMTLREIGVQSFRRVVEIPLSAGYRLAPSVYAAMRGALEAQVHEHWRNKLTLIALGSRQVRNLFSNVMLFPQAGDFSQLSSTKPVVVAGAGPSLEESLPTLRAARGKMTLLAVDTALPRLAVESLQPDIVIALEAQTHNLRDFLPAPGPQTCLACELSSHPTAARLFGPRVFFFSSEFAPVRLFRRMRDAGILPCPFPALGSVGVAAVSAALHLTAGDLFLTGLDFSYPGSITHARGTPSHMDALAETSRFDPPEGPSFRSIASRRRKMAPDKTGRPVLTDTVMESYRNNLAMILVGCRDRVYDAGASGLDLGVPRITTRQLGEKLAAGRTQSAALACQPSPMCSPEKVRAFFSSEKDLLQRGEKQIRDAMRSGASPQECLGFLDEADYAWLHFPDESPVEDPDQSFLARAAASAAEYARRLGRLESLF